MKFITTLILLIISLVGFSQQTYVSKIDNPICSDFCQITLSNEDKVVFFTDLGDIIIFGEEGESINPFYINKEFIIETEIITSFDELGQYSLEVIKSIYLKSK